MARQLCCRGMCKNCCDLIAGNGVMAKRSFHRIWIAGKKLLVKRAPDYSSFRCYHLDRFWISLIFITSDNAQFIMCAIGRLNNDLKVVFCLGHATPSHYHHAASLTCIEHMRWNIPKAYVNSFWVYSVESVSQNLMSSHDFLPHFLCNIWGCLC